MVWSYSQTPAAETHSVYVDDLGVVYAGTNAGVFRCDVALRTDYCQSGGWEPFGLNATPPRYVLAVRKAHPGRGYPDPTFWAATSDGLWRATGSPAPTWQHVAGTSGYVFSDVEPVAGRDHCVYAAMGFIHGAVQHRGGVRFSSDNGATWTSLTAGSSLHNAPVSDVLVQPTSLLQPPEPRLAWVASWGRGVWQYDWGTALPVECQ